jgi:AraC-like DNA-binding protein
VRSIALPSCSVTIPARLRDRIVSIDVVVDDVALGPRAPVLPGLAVVLGVQWRGRMRGPEGLLALAGVTGIQQRARTYEALGRTTSILVRFTPTGASCLGVPVHELASRSVALDEILDGQRVREFVERVAEATNAAAACDVVIDVLDELNARRDRLVERALDLLACNGGGREARVADVARSLAVSERQLERRFSTLVGVTPKRWQELNRFHAALTALRTSDSGNLLDVALDAGYYDQAHFNRDIRKRTGTTPTGLLRAR